MLSMLAIPVLGNDAGTGGDAGNTTSTATPLPATNGTYYGNLTSSSDTSDYYLINMSSNTGIAVEITYPSSADFDLALLDSGGVILILVLILELQMMSHQIALQLVEIAYISG